MNRRRFINGWALRALLTVMLLVPMLTIGPVPRAAPRAHPLLLRMAAERPEEMVGVIVQEPRGDGAAEALVARLGGRVTKDLRFIRAFAAELPAGAVPKLARAEGVRWVSPDAPVVQADCEECVDTSRLANAYIRAIGADRLWNEPPYLQGQDVTVAIVDSGIAPHNDLRGERHKGRYRVWPWVNLIGPSHRAHDWYGHGTHVAGIIGGNGSMSNGAYIGVAPKVHLVTVKVCDEQGAGSTSDVVAGLQWVYEHRDAYNIRVVNLSMNSSVPESYHTSPLDAALEILWFNGIVVVVSAGNNGDGADNGILYPPANDPFVITVGAADDEGTPDTGDDVLAHFSAYGVTESGFAKPDLVAPGADIISLLPPTSHLYFEHPDHRLDGRYFRMSGTSMASAVTVGAVALLLQDEPDLTPDQVKLRLMATARPFSGPEPGSTGAGYLDVYAAVHGTTTESANTGTVASQLLWSGADPVAWDSVNWDSVNWDSVNWDSVHWDD